MSDPVAFVVRVEMPDLSAAIARMTDAMTLLAKAMVIAGDLKVEAAALAPNGTPEDTTAGEAAKAARPPEARAGQSAQPRAMPAITPSPEAGPQPAGKPPVSADSITTRARVTTWTQERRAIIERDWPAGRAVAAITADLNRLPGNPVDNTKVGVQAAQMGLKRPAGFAGQKRELWSAPARTVMSPPSGAAVEATWDDVAAYARDIGIRFDGDMEPVNHVRAKTGKPPFVLVQPFGPGSTPSGPASQAPA